MRLKVILAIGVALGLCLIGAVLALKKDGSTSKANLTLRIAVEPPGQSDFVVQQANTAKFKYLVGNMSGVKPVFAQKVLLKPVPNTNVLEAQVGADTEEEARRYAEHFVRILQQQCGQRARLTLTEQTIR